jgi:hypothetical protein
MSQAFSSGVFRSVVLMVVVFTFQASRVSAAVFTYEDDFATDKAITDSYAHSPIFHAPVGGISEFLYYHDEAGNRVLGFEPAFDVPPGRAFITYRGIPADTQLVVGVVEFDFTKTSSYGTMAVYGLTDNMTEKLFGKANSNGRYAFMFPPDAPFSFFTLAGYGLIDNLKVSAIYTPEPGTLLLLTAAAFAMFRRRPRF